MTGHGPRGTRALADLPCRMEGFGIITRRDRLLSPAGEVMLRAIRATAQTLYGLEGAGEFTTQSEN